MVADGVAEETMDTLADGETDALAVGVVPPPPPPLPPVATPDDTPTIFSVSISRPAVV